MPRKSYGNRSSYRRNYHNGNGSDAARRRHVQEANEFSREIGGTDEDVKGYFFSLGPAELGSILNEYGEQFGSDAEAYARQTFLAWKAGRTRMSGLVAKRLFSLLPKRMPLALKYELAGNIWRHFGPTSKHAFVVGVDTPVEEIAAIVAQTFDDTVKAYNIPTNVAARFEWLAGGDVGVKEQLLNYFRQQEKALALEKVRHDIPVLQTQMRNHAGVTGMVRSVLQVHKHEIAIRVRKGGLNGIEIDRNPTGTQAGGGLLQYWWLFGLLAFGLYWLSRQ